MTTAANEPKFADSSFYVALLSSRDELHRQAVKLTHEQAGEVVTTEFVLVEVAAMLRRSERSRRAVLELWKVIEDDGQTRVVPASSDLVERGRQLYGKRLDKEWSLTDCISFVVMNDGQIRQAMTADRDFEQAGFVRMLVPG